MPKLCLAAVMAVFSYAPLYGAVVTFEELSLGNPGDGSAQYLTTGRYFWNGSNGAGGFTSGGATLANSYTDFGGGFYAWEGFAYSNTTDTVSGALENQYSAVAGGGADGSSIYAVGFQPYATEWGISFSTAQNLAGGGLNVTNTTYTYNRIRDGDTFSKKFGGVSGHDADWFRLTIQGWNGLSNTGSVDFYLADYRFADNSLDYIVDDWTFVDLGALGTVDKITLNLTSSDNGMFGMNTPAYVAVDNVTTVPEPGMFGLLALGVLLISLKRNYQVK